MEQREARRLVKAVPREWRRQATCFLTRGGVAPPEESPPHQEKRSGRRERRKRREGKRREEEREETREEKRREAREREREREHDSIPPITHLVTD